MGWDDPGSAGTDADAIHDNVAGEIAAVTEKVTPVSADLLLIEDSADSNNKKRVQAGNLPGGGSAVEVGCRAYLSSDQTVSNTTHTTVNFDAETYDPLSMHDPASNPSRLTVPVGFAGDWLLLGQIAWRGNSTGDRVSRIQQTGTLLTVFDDRPGHSGLYAQTIHEVTVSAAEGDYFEMTGFQASGGNLNLVGSETRTFLIAVFLG